MAERKGKAVAGGRKKRTPSLAVRKACFLEVLRQTANVSRAAREAGLSSSTVYTHRAKFPAFARDWDAAVEEALDELESGMIERAREGVDKPVFYRGEVIGNVRSYSDALGMFLLKARRPQVYGRAASPEPVAPESAEPPVIIEGMTQEEAKAEVLRRLDRLAEGDEDGER